MKKTFLFISAATFVIFSVQSCGTDASKKPGADTVDSATVSPSVNGKTLYEEKCTLCHGADGKQNTMGAADLSTSTLNHETVTTIIKTGKNGMKAFSPELNDEQIEAVGTYVESLRK
jgi:mono/diheme cytochrome c family protein